MQTAAARRHPLAAHPTLVGATPAELDRLARRVRPVTLADQQVLPLLPALEPLTPWSGLQRGIVAGVAGRGATTLTLALAAGPSAAGSWTAAVGLASLGLAAAAEIGVDLGRLAVIDTPPADKWPEVVAALIGAFDLVLVQPAHPVRPPDALRLAARARERGTVVVHVETDRSRWATAHDLHLAVTRVRWQGLGQGHGHLRSRRVRIEATGRRAAARPRRADLWLPGPDGQVAPFSADADHGDPVTTGPSEADHGDPTERRDPSGHLLQPVG